MFDRPDNCLSAPHHSDFSKQPIGCTSCTLLAFCISKFKRRVMRQRALDHDTHFGFAAAFKDFHYIVPLAHTPSGFMGWSGGKRLHQVRGNHKHPSLLREELKRHTNLSAKCWLIAVDNQKHNLVEFRIAICSALYYHSELVTSNHGTTTNMDM